MLDMIGLYSNVAEGPGFIADPTIGHKQKDWLEQTLTKIKTARTGKARNALIIGVRHPFFSSGAHSGSPQCCSNEGFGQVDVVLDATQDFVVDGLFVEPA